MNKNDYIHNLLIVQLRIYILRERCKTFEKLLPIKILNTALLAEEQKYNKQKKKKKKIMFNSKNGIKKLYLQGRMLYSY